MPTEHQLLIFWLQLLALLFTARAARRRPARDRAAGRDRRADGGPAARDRACSDTSLRPARLACSPAEPLQRALLAGPAWIGVFLLLILTGLETDPALIRSLGRATARVAIGSLVPARARGHRARLRAAAAFVGGETERVVFALFMGTALGISALPVIAKILSDSTDAAATSRRC
jgi:hypothetical protein